MVLVGRASGSSVKQSPDSSREPSTSSWRSKKFCLRSSVHSLLSAQRENSRSQVSRHSAAWSSVQPSTVMSGSGMGTRPVPTTRSRLVLIAPPAMGLVRRRSRDSKRCCGRARRLSASALPRVTIQRLLLGDRGAPVPPGAAPLKASKAWRAAARLIA